MKVTGHEVGVVAGRWQARTVDGTASPETDLPTASKGELLAFLAVYDSEGAEPLLDSSAIALADELRRRLAAAYYRDPARSVTASLGHALGAVNRALYSANEANPPDVRRFVATSCVVAREGEIFVALAGPATACVLAGSSVETFAPSEDAAAATLVGSESEVAAEYAHRTIDGPTAVLLSTSAVAEALPDGQVGELLPAGSGAATLEKLRSALEAGSSADLSAMLVEISAPDAWSSLDADGMTAALPWDGVDLAGESTTASARQVRSEAAIPPKRPRRARRVSGASARLPLLVAAAVVAVVLFYLFPVRIFLEYRQDQEQQALVQQAQQKEQDARVAADQASRLKLLVEASGLASQAAESGGADAAAADLDSRLKTEVDTLTTTVRLSAPARLASLNGQPAQLVLGSSDLFVLDRGNGQVLRYPLEVNRLGVQAGGSPSVFRKGDKIGEQALGTPEQILWMPGGSGRSEGFLILDSTGTLFEWVPGEGLKIARFSKGQSHLPLLAGYAGTLYALDATDDALEWRPPSSGVYDLAAYPYFQPDVSASVADVVSLAVAEDLYVLRQSGQIDRFTLGKPSTFAGAPLDRPLGVGSTITATPRGVYAFDPTNRRIVQFARDGTYLRQFAFEGSEKLVDVALDESRGLIYALGPQGLYLYRSSDLAALPPLPTPAVSEPTPAPTAASTPKPTARPVASPTVIR